MNKDELIKEIRSMPSYGYISIPEELKNDYDVGIEAVKHDGMFSQLGEELRKNKEIILLAAKYDSRVLYWTSDDNLKKDKEFLIEYVKNGGSLRYADSEIRDDDEFMLEAIRVRGNAFSGVSNRLRKDKEFIKKAVVESRKFKPEIEYGWKDEQFIITSILHLIPLEILDGDFMKELKEILETKKKMEQTERHNLSEIADAVSDRKTQDVNKIVSEISQEMKDKLKDNEQIK